MYQLRDYQLEASNAAVEAFNKGKKNGIIIAPTGAGKSLIIADIASKIDYPLLVFCPSKEILEQNVEKYMSYGFLDCGIYSASANKKDINKVTFATIGSVINHQEDFDCFKYILVDECHNVNPEGGMYHDFINAKNRVVVGLTATPYRLKSYGDGFCVLKFITRSKPKIFQEVLCAIQIGDLINKGYLAKLKYYDITKMDMRNVKSNSTGADYDETSLKREYDRSKFYDNLINTVNRLKSPKNGVKRNGILVFTRFLEEAKMLADNISGCVMVEGSTPKKTRESIIKNFKNGNIQIIVNVGIFTTGFDYPELDTIVLARPTKSLALYYQMVGRAIRKSEGKDGWIIDMCGNYKRFGDVSDLRLEEYPKKNNWCVMSRGKQLTNVMF